VSFLIVDLVSDFVAPARGELAAVDRLEMIFKQ
jgi:hypothetical protein